MDDRPDGEIALPEVGPVVRSSFENLHKETPKRLGEELAAGPGEVEVKPVRGPGKAQEGGRHLQVSQSGFEAFALPAPTSLSSCPWTRSVGQDAAVARRSGEPV